MRAKTAVLLVVVSALLMSGAVVSGAQRRPAPELAPSRMRWLLSLPREKTPLAAEVLQQSADNDVAIEDIRFRAEQDLWVPALMIKPRVATQLLPAIICPAQVGRGNNSPMRDCN